MQIHSIYDDEFKTYGRVLSDVPAELTEPLVAAMREHVALPEPEGTAYEPSMSVLENLDAAAQLGLICFGGLPFQLGCVRGRNTKLNCLEYHRSSEFNLGTDDFILLLAHEWDIERDADGKPFLDTNKIQAFRAPASVLLEVFATTLHYTPCHADEQAGFRVLVALPRGTNEKFDASGKQAVADILDYADVETLWSTNKFQLVHAESPKAAQGAYIGLRGENWDLA